MWKQGKQLPQGLEFSIKRGLEPVKKDYDVILIDCPPGLSLFSSTALLASDFFVSPIIPDPLSLEGVKLVKNRALALSKVPGVSVEFAGVLLNLVKSYRNTQSKL